MSDLEKEAEEYSEKNEFYTYDEKLCCYDGYIGCANSNYAKQQVIKGKIEVLEECKDNFDNYAPSKFHMKLCDKINELKQLETPEI